MLLHHFSTRFLFGLTTVAAVYSLLIAAAFRGSPAATALCLATLGLAIAMVNYIVCFAAVSWFAERLRMEAPQPQHPFATDAPPKQLVPPTE